MCVVSNIGDDYGRTFPYRWPQIQTVPNTNTFVVESEVSKEDFDKLKAEVEELKKLLQAAKEYDAATGQANCEMDEKVALIKQIAELVGVDLGDLFEPTT